MGNCSSRTANFLPQPVFQIFKTNFPGTGVARLPPVDTFESTKYAFNNYGGDHYSSGRYSPSRS
jgi:hypothetical protein